MWLVSTSNSEWALRCCADVRIEYRSDAAGVRSGCREIHVPPTFPHLRSAFGCTFKQPLLLFYLYFLSILELASSITVHNKLHRRLSRLISHHIANTQPYRHCSQPTHLRAPRPHESLPCSSRNPTDPLLVLLLIASLELVIHNNSNRLNVWLRC